VQVTPERPFDTICTLVLNFSAEHVTMIRIYICLGPHCRRRGSADILSTLEQELRQAHLLERIECIAGGCQDRCALGPNLLIYPGGRRMHGVALQAIGSLVAQLIDGGV